MTTPSDDIAEADRLGRRRARLMPLLALMFIAQQASFVVMPAPDDPVRSVDQVKVGAWLLLSAVLVGLLWTGGMWLHGRAVRALMNDEAARANRADALSLGFLFAMAAALLLYGLAGIEGVGPIGLREAVHIIVTAGIVPALIRFGILERRGFD
jgi:hypothetical protein